ncbi:uncharacterized protein FTJAE_11969 [Fusarium tjaetaba]|uniref:F-box domain-containing protein n=1 Tax=Fusarium tjaetaba TaxID=1567544 RepID=A0A8H5QNK8_9HYPO|nr:uncharacterized protein FTJAE_11969 [Fusarium tjaetaba]KAF5619286.1 hypothetical protein FTJAE_11969 [Fusarium tjaetaba]
MARLKDIPNEILTIIFTHLSDIDHSSIFNVTLVNKHFNQLASPLRVRHWTDEGYYGYYDDIEYYDGDSLCPPISRLALELLRHPEYRLQVRTLSFSFPGFNRSGDRNATRPMKPENLQMLARAAEEVVPTLAKSTCICARILEGKDDAIATLVLAWATNLRCLSMTIPSFDPTPGHDEGPLVLHFAKQLALRFDDEDAKPHALLPLAKLRELEFRNGYIDTILGLKFLTPFLYLPNLKILKTYRVGDQVYNDPEEDVQNYTKDKYCMPFPKGTSSIESVTMRETNLTSEGLADLLVSCTSLRYFYLDFSWNLENIKRNWTILARSLINHAASLEELHLCVDHCEVEWVGDTVGDGTGDPKTIDFNCYHQLTRLEVLRVPMPHLYGHDLGSRLGPLEASPVGLPESIQRVRLLDMKLCCDSLYRPEHEISPFLDFVFNLIGETGPQGRLRNLHTLDCIEALCDILKSERMQEIKDLAEERGVNILLC